MRSGCWLCAWHPPQLLRTSPGLTWCHVCAIVRSRPSLSSIWKLSGVSAGIFARKLVSRLPSGSRIGAPFVSNFFKGTSPSLHHHSDHPRCFRFPLRGGGHRQMEIGVRYTDRPFEIHL